MPNRTSSTPFAPTGRSPTTTEELAISAELTPSEATAIATALGTGRSRRADHLVEWLATADHADADPILDDLARSGVHRDAALDALVAVLYRSRFVRSVIRRVVLDDDMVDEALQNTVLAVVHGLSTWRGEASFRSWAAAIASRQAAAVLRAARPDRTGPRADVEPLLPVERFSSQLADRTRIEAALVALPEHYRSIVWLRDVEHRPYQEIAATVGIPLNTVRSRLARGRALAQRALQLDIDGELR